MKVSITKGKILIYRIFDLGEEISLEKARLCLKDVRGNPPLQVPKFIDRGIVVRHQPLAFGLGEEKVQLENETLSLSTIGRVRDFGVLSLLFEYTIPPGSTWDELREKAVALEEGTAIDDLACRIKDEVALLLTPAINKPSHWRTFEDYTIYFLQELDGANGENLIDRVDVPALLLAERNPQIAEETRKSVLENQYRYLADDLAIVEWNSALVVEPDGGSEVPDILEFAVTHLLEMRYYDYLLEQRLQVLYNDIEKSRGRWLRGRYHELYQEASSRYIEFAEFIERVENSLKVVGDFYLATVYRAANRKFRLSDWQQNVTRKMNLLAQVSNLLQGEVNTRRSHWLEITIILLIAFEIVSAIWK
jgi:hypothetical protein